MFDKYDILNRIDMNGSFRISAAQIREYREPRLMAKFDHTVNLPGIFS
ncbi:MAG: transcriptional regulator, partial [Oscillospiraceae bacterium]|nr:transcriptional regulator [Oscillospiraceae bacterium]